MNKNKKTLDELFDQARSVPPFISKDDSRLFLERRNTQYTTVIEPRPFYQNKKFYITGAAMATIALIVFFVTSIMNHSDQQLTFSQQNNLQKQSPQTFVDSTKEKSDQKSVVTKQEITSPNQLSKSVVDRVVTKHTDDQKKINPNVSFASWMLEKVHAVKIFELDSVELDKIGIKILSDGSIEQIWGTERPLRVSVKQVDTNMVTYTFPIKEHKIVDTLSNSLLRKPRFNAVIITDNLGKKYMYMDNYKLYPVNKLLPIKIDKAPFPHQQPNDRYFIYWFERTPEFIAALPKRIQQIIQSENDEGLKPVESEFTDNTSKTIHPIDASVYPNPVSTNSTTLQYTLPEQRRVAVSLYNIQGERLKEFPVTEQREKGKWEEQLSLGDLQSGMYLLAVMTDKGEQSVQRIIIEH